MSVGLNQTKPNTAHKDGQHQNKMIVTLRREIYHYAISHRDYLTMVYEVSHTIMSRTFRERTSLQS